jgi:plastocyanin
VIADDGSFESPIMAPGEEYKRTFAKAGPIKYYCSLHGGAGGMKMAGTITVK